MANTTSLSSGKKSGVNKKLGDFFSDTVAYDIHELEGLLRVSEIYLTHVMKAINEKKNPRWVIAKPETAQKLDIKEIPP